jgi:hypothetical protein
MQISERMAYLLLIISIGYKFVAAIPLADWGKIG